RVAARALHFDDVRRLLPHARILRRFPRAEKTRRPRTRTPGVILNSQESFRLWQDSRPWQIPAAASLPAARAFLYPAAWREARAARASPVRAAACPRSAASIRWRRALRAPAAPWR